MMLFVLMFVIQWTISSVCGVWKYLHEAPPVVVLLTVILVNSRGALYAIVFVVIHRKNGTTGSSADGYILNGSIMKPTGKK